MKGLSFSENMVRAWLAGKKTVTRRLVKFNIAGRVQRGGKQWHIADPNAYLAARYLPGETVYIKETWMQFPGYGEIFYKATDEAEYDESSMQEGHHPWKSPRFMPESASRSRARIVSVRPERIQSITEAEAIKEGMKIGGSSMGHVFTHREHFEALWESLHPGTWDQNPWVWVISLERID